MERERVFGVKHFLHRKGLGMDGKGDGAAVGEHHPDLPVPLGTGDGDVRNTEAVSSRKLKP